MSEIQAAHRQRDYSLRMEWGATGAAAVAAADCEVAVIVDILSFTTTLTVAVDLGIAVYPCPWRDEQAAALAKRAGATLAVGRAEAGNGQVSLSPASIRAGSGMRRLVLPSPNGSAICFQFAGSGPEVVGLSLRNSSAVAGWLRARRAENPDLRVGVVAAGERWGDGSLRPAVEDLWGAGALISELVGDGWEAVSPEARAAASAFRAVADDIGTGLRTCASGRELIDRGYAEDVELAGENCLSRSVPILREGAFVRSSAGAA